jgi:hypothetical protein
MPLLATALMCTAIGTVCGGPAAVHPTPAAKTRPASRFAIAFERSGGLKGSVETLVVRAGLRAYATAPKGTREASKHFRMNADNAEEIRRELRKARFGRLKSSADPGACADCYVYSITYRHHTVLFLESQAIGHLGEAVDSLEEEVIEHLYRHVGYRGA